MCVMRLNMKEKIFFLLFPRRCLRPYERKTYTKWLPYVQPLSNGP
jgi:hypothetical protein